MPNTLLGVGAMRCLLRSTQSVGSVEKSRDCLMRWNDGAKSPDEAGELGRGRLLPVFIAKGI